MPLSKIHRLVNYLTDGQQLVVGTLYILGPAVVELDPSVYTKAGTYILFRFNAWGAGSDISNLTIDDSSLSGLTASAPTLVESEKIIRISLS